MADPSASSGTQSELNTWLVEELYEQYREDPSSLSSGWQEFRDRKSVV